jgi:hypothetical protein
MKKLFSFCLLVMALATVKAQTAPTWSADVASIVYNKCSNCHHAGAIGPFPLMSYQDAFVQAAGIEGAVYDNKMPPWPPDPSYRRYAHERLLSPEEKTKILDWVSNGAPEGDPNTAPTPPVFSTAWEIANPSLSVVMPDYFSEAVSDDIYKCFAIPTGLTEDKFIKSIEVIPGNRAVVHHVLIFQDQSGDCLALDAADPNPGYTNYGGAGSSNAKLVGGWAPGARPYSLPNGFGIKLKANSALVLQIHYPSGTAGSIDSTRVNFEFTDGTSVREVYVFPVLNHVISLVDGPLSIAANQVRTFTEEYTVPNKMTVFSVSPHMHLIGRDTKVYGLPPNNGDTLKLINIPDWNFGWQGAYQFQYAQPIEAGTLLRSINTYDNTVNNPYNPNNPPQEVSLGESTDEEMMLTFFAYSLYQPGDENILMDSTLLATSSPEIPQVKLGVSFYPNPATSNVFIDIPNDSDSYTLNLYNQTGQMVLSRRLQQDGWFDIATLSAGVYIANVSSTKGTYTHKLVKY